jgi:PleD family two-component response regulator
MLDGGSRAVKLSHERADSSAAPSLLASTLRSIPAVSAIRQIPFAKRSPEIEVEPGSAGRLLIVDDLEENREILSRLFVRRGFEIVEAECGSQALRLAATNTFDCVLLDVIMPGMDGNETLRRLREKFTLSLLPVIMVTGMNETEHVVSALNNGANDYVTKPVNFAVTLQRVVTQISLRRADMEQRASELLLLTKAR